MNIKLDETKLHIEWLNRKLTLNYRADNATMQNIRNIKRGDVFYCDFGMGVGSEMQKQGRPCVVIQNRQANINSPIAIVAPITHTGKNIGTIVELSTKFGNDDSTSYVNLSQITTVSKIRLGDKICALNNDDINKIDKAIAYSLEIYKHYDKLKKKNDKNLLYIEKVKQERNIAQDSLKDILNTLGVADIDEAKSKIANLTNEHK
ncbi:type II toxin-antitoxin system PemK/MazF family toxin [Romboutsia sp.]|uniref:type II toxin-antitoxin system PemK/MazF family toxin n=1 Tax=Romboutsia sp. TaxID=1965302 RepID=UPI003F38BFA0